MTRFSTRGGASKTCTCKVCGISFLSRKLQPFCSSTCRTTQNTTSPAILEGAIQHDQTNPNSH